MKKNVLFLTLFLAMMPLPSFAMEFLPVSEVREGMKGYAKTVIHGTKIDTFDVDVLGVMKNKGATGGDLVLVKVSGPIIDETNGIAQGMSGSPVYIDGKLLGAVSYGFPQSGGRIGMVTPISDMLSLWTIDEKKKNSFIPATPTGMIPIDTPLMATGYTGNSLEFLSEKMSNFHMVPVSAASVVSDETGRPLEEGGAVAASLVTGDLRLGAIGTVTYVDGKRMVAFGHPFMNKGTTDYFMHNSNIFTVVPSANIPFKMGSVGAEIGMVNQDRGAGISGIDGQLPDSVSLHVTVSDEDTGKRENLNVRMVQNEALLPTLAATSIYNAVSNAIDRKGQGTVSFSYALYPKNQKYKPFKRENMYWSGKDISERSVDEIYNVIRLLEQNQFESYDLRNVTMDMTVTKERKTARIIDAAASPTVVSPGDTIYIQVRLQPYRGNIVIKNLTFTVPKDQSYGDMMLEVRGGGVVPLPYLIEQQKYNLTDEIRQRLQKYNNFSDFQKKLSEEDKNNEIIVEIIEIDISMISKDGASDVRAEIQNKQAEKSPAYLRREKNAKETGNRDLPKSRLETEYVIYGDGQFRFKVMPIAERDAALKKLAKDSSKAMLEMKKELKDNSEVDDTKKKQG